MTIRLDDLVLFAAVAKAGSFRDVSRTKHLSPSAVSKAIRRLEGQLELTLLERTTRSVFPTYDGARLLQRLEPALLEVEAAVAWVVSPQDPGVRETEMANPFLPELDRRTWP